MPKSSTTAKHAKLHKIIENANDKTLFNDVDDEKSDNLLCMPGIMPQ